jgi:hypothetical protein
MYPPFVEFASLQSCVSSNKDTRIEANRISDERSFTKLPARNEVTLKSVTNHPVFEIDRRYKLRTVPPNVEIHQKTD